MLFVFIYLIIIMLCRIVGSIFVPVLCLNFNIVLFINPN